ncbi:MAG: O-antigen ligase family protein, partial [Planctomycetaceae bacterium]
MTHSAASRAARPVAPPLDPGGWFTWLGGTLLAMACVGRLLTATEAASIGGTLGFALLSSLSLAVLTAGRAWSVSPPPRWQVVDGLIALLCGSPLLAWLAASPTADLRAGATMIAEWVGLWATWCCLRTLQWETAWVGRLQRLIVCVVFALALLGIWQNLEGYRQAREDYRKLKAELGAAQQRLADPSDPAARLRARDDVRRLEAIYLELGIPLDPAGQLLWESRLEHSQEPVGLFALANTFAAVLLSGLAWWLWPPARASFPTSVGKPSAPAHATPPKRVGWGRVLAVVPIAFCLLLTKCRSAWLASLAMGPLAAWVTWRESRGTPPTSGTSPLPRRLWLAGAVLGLGLVVTAVAGGQLDRLVVLESFKSLRYRIEYWQGTWQMLSAPEHPTRWLTGVGPGQFRSNYLPFKLPQSSEEIADPHNALFDHWAS